MAQIRRAIGNEHHLFIMLGPSKGVRQITGAGIDWLEKHQYFLPEPGNWVPLDVGDYRRLDRQGYLYIKGEEYTKLSPQPFNIPLVPAETVQYSPPLLLQLSDNSHDTDITAWQLILKMDEWEKDARDALIQAHAVAVGCYSVSETGEHIFSSISLGQIGRADYWPDVTPHEEDYVLYWQSDQLYHNESLSAILLKEATPTKGLKAGWQGNVFFNFTGSGLQNAWKRYLPGMSISASHSNELYWLAQSDQEPEPSWPGKVQRIGEPNQGWQLWHLKAVPETDKEDIAEWLWYRQIHRRYSTWRLHLLNSLSSVSAHGYISTYTPSRWLLVRCDPPIQQQGNTFLSLTPYSKSTTSQQQPTGSSMRSSYLVSDSENYLRVPPPSTNEEYRIAVSIAGNATSQSLRIQAASLSTRQPIWLSGLCCSLTIADETYPMKAFSDKPISKSYSYQLSIHKDFLLEQLEQAAWNYQPSGIPCLLRWEYLSPHKKLCQGPVTSILTENALTSWWQNYIWPKVAESSWVKLTLDAANFGSIKIHLILKPVPVPVSQQKLASEPIAMNAPIFSEIWRSKKPSANISRQAWWENPHYMATFFWLCRIAEQEKAQTQQAHSLELAQMLEQLCVPDMPATLKNALMRLAINHNLPVWVYMRLQTLLTDVYLTFELSGKERW